MRGLKDALVASKSKFLRDRNIGYINQSNPLIIQHGDQRAKDK